MVHHCNAASATIVASHMKFGLVFDTTSGAYVPGSDVTQHNALDKDQAAMEAALKIADFTAATAAYATGGKSTTNSGCTQAEKTGETCFNSMSKGKARPLKGFSTKAKGKMYDGAALKDGVGPALVCPG